MALGDQDADLKARAARLGRAAIRTSFLKALRGRGTVYEEPLDTGLWPVEELSPSEVRALTDTEQAA